MKIKNSWVKQLYALTLFVEDKDRTKNFYQAILGLSVAFEDKNSVVFKVGDLLVNFLKTTAAGELISPLEVDKDKLGARMVMTIHVSDVDAKCHELNVQGIDLLTGPVDRSWGVRTANFIDPDGYVWEIASPLDGQ